MSRMIVTVTAVLMLITGAATAFEVTLNPSSDAGIYSGNPDYHYGNLDFGWIGYLAGWTESLIYFDLSGYMGVIVEEAILEIHTFEPWGALPGTNWVFPVNGAWDESIVTWNTNPGYNTNHFMTFPAPMMGWVSLDVTAFVVDWIGGTNINYGFYLRQTDTTFGGFLFTTKEGDEKPKLTITYQYSDLEQTTFGCIKALFMQ